MSDQSPAATAAAPDDPATARAEIDHTREALGETVEALVDKVDVKARAKATIDDRKRRLREQRDHLAAGIRAHPERLAAVLGALVALFGALAIRRRSGRR